MGLASIECVGKLGFAWEEWSPPASNEKHDRIAKIVAQIDESALYPLEADYLADGIIDA
ncbi:hypothetical protein GQ53DRAFT_747354 [Thozetella sp. PMI_491]|nr:hypothetical protein GQ53DRAFT_747354 [Thozetella sp. PMI_491]